MIKGSYKTYCWWLTMGVCGYTVLASMETVWYDMGSIVRIEQLDEQGNIVKTII